MVFIAVIALGTTGFTVLEHFALLDALYFTIVTIATVGYGDLHPVTPAGKLFAIFIIIAGVGSFVGLIANSVEMWITKREQQRRLKKLNMIIGAFFSETGIGMLGFCIRADPKLEEIRKQLIVTSEWTDAEFSRITKVLKNYESRSDIYKIDLPELRDYLKGRDDFMLRLLENPMLLEFEPFAELLRAIFHLTEELLARDKLTELPASDYTHLQNDINRVYTLLLQQWLEYMRHLKENYPYLFSLAMRTNPFDRNASPIVR